MKQAMAMANEIIVYWAIIVLRAQLSIAHTDTETSSFSRAIRSASSVIFNPRSRVTPEMCWWRNYDEVLKARLCW